MSIEELIARYERLLANLDMELANICEEIALTAKALIVNRIQTKGLDGKRYSDKKIPAYLLLLDEDRLDTQQTIDFVKRKAKAKKEEDRYTNWKEIRQALGKETAFVDLTFTGRMLNNLQVIKTEKVNDVFSTMIGGFEEEVRKKLDWNTTRYGDFLKLTPEEQQAMEVLQVELVNKMFKRYLEE